MISEFMYALLGIACALIIHAISYAGTVLLFYRLHPDNEWYTENYRELPKFLQIFG